MIEAVSALSNVSTSLKADSQAAIARAPVDSTPQPEFTSSRIRFDNNFNIAILEYRSSDTGQVVRQYPTELQIRAFRRASEIEAHNAEERQAEEAHASQAQSSADTHAETGTPAPTISLPAPSTASADTAHADVTISSTSGSDSGGSSSSTSSSSGSTQSVVV